MTKSLIFSIISFSVHTAHPSIQLAIQLIHPFIHPLQIEWYENPSYHHPIPVSVLHPLPPTHTDTHFWTSGKKINGRPLNIKHEMKLTNLNLKLPTAILHCYPKRLACGQNNCHKAFLCPSVRLHEYVARVSSSLSVSQSVTCSTIQVLDCA